jgi:hypothetical protein
MDGRSMYDETYVMDQRNMEIVTNSYNMDNN